MRQLNIFEYFFESVHFSFYVFSNLIELMVNFNLLLLYESLQRSTNFQGATRLLKLSFGLDNVKYEKLFDELVKLVRDLLCVYNGVKYYVRT